jgi:FtsP/CotA-like multicopper oxidase with cupredoxin domain
VPANFESLTNLDIQFALFLVVSWGLASLLAGRHPARRWSRAPRVRPIVGLAAIVLGTVFLAIRTVVDLRMAQGGLLLVEDRFVVALPVVGLPALAALWFSGRPLLREARQPTVDNRLATFNPAAVIPVYGAFLGALVAFSGTIFIPLAPPLTGPAIEIFVVDAVLLALAWSWQGRRFLAANNDRGYRRRRWPIRILRIAGAVASVLVLLVGSLVVAAQTSKLPAVMSMNHQHDAATHAAAPVSVATLTAASGPVQKRFTLVAKETTIRLASGKEMSAWAFNGQVPGPELHVGQDQLVEITVVNDLTDTNLSIHWHGIDVPNAMDGVPGVTQDAIRPGGTFVYRFRPHELGTHWYHSHELGSVQVKKGLFGAFIVDPPATAATATAASTTVGQDWFIAQHTWYTGATVDPTATGPDVLSAFGTADQEDRRTAKPGSPVRLRLLNSDSLTKHFTLTGTPFRVIAVDGGPVNAPTALVGRQLTLGSGGRFDVEFTMPTHPVRLVEIRAAGAGLLITPDGTGDLAPQAPTGDFDPTTYGSTAPTPFGATSHFDRQYTMLLDNQLGFYDGTFTFKWTVNGNVFPDIPPLVVSYGDLVKLTLANRSHYDHPMHLHGHQVLVLSRNGHPVTGSPLWMDTVTVGVGEVWVVAFRADNPGIWMDHCHIFEHAAEGMMTDVVYDAVSTPFTFGSGTPNQPE